MLFKRVFTDEINDIYYAEKHITKTFLKLKKAAGSAELIVCFEEHLVQTKTHVERLEQVFELLGKKGTGKKMRGHRRYHQGRRRNH